MGPSLNPSLLLAAIPATAFGACLLPLLLQRFGRAAAAVGAATVMAACLALLLPLAGALSALLMAIAIRCRSVKEAQANATALVLVVSLLPLLTLFNQEGEAPWHLGVPALAQITLMGRVLKGEPIAPWELALPLGVSALLVALCLAFVARSLRAASLK
jgi:sodium transport system permease protein